MAGLALLVQVARARLAPEGPATITTGDGHELRALAGASLLDALAEAGVLLPAACGGAGSCGLCRVRVTEGGGAVSPIERATLGRAAARGTRLACQVRVRDGLRVVVPEEARAIRTWTCRVRSARSLTPLIREVVLALPPGERLDFRAGAFVQVTCPPFRLRLGDLAAAAEHGKEWTRLGISDLVAHAHAPVTRAYSLANHPNDTDAAVLFVRLALPPPSHPKAPPGVVSSWLFSVAEGDEVTMEGPHGHFFVEDGDRELVFIGGGVGLAPLRAHVLEQLERRGARRAISLWYGARSRADLFHADEFERLAREHENFTWRVALSEPAAQDAWDGPTGFIHRVVHDEYLATHPAPEDCAYYLCGPPMMVQATVAMLLSLGVEEDSILHDDFGA